MFLAHIPRVLFVVVLVSFHPIILLGKSDTDPRFETEIAPILEANCLACHGSGQLQADLDLRSRDSILKGGKSGPAVIPGKPLQSLLLGKVSSGSMPPGDGSLSPDQNQLIRRWIETGALRQGEKLESSPKIEKHEEVSGREIVVTILNVKCLLCHGRRNQQGGLDLRTRASLLKGGNSGPAIVPGKPDESLLIERVLSEEMPPLKDQARASVRPVTSGELEKLRGWIAAGAPFEEEEPKSLDPQTDPLVNEEDRRFWSFQPPRRVQVPEVGQRDGDLTPIDAFLLRRLEEKGLSFAPAAEPLTLMRRAYFDVTGLPPSPEEVVAYREDNGSGAYERLIDRLLDSPGYGEHWGRHWLDAVGYADSEGQVSADAHRPNAWRYRDYVVRSLNADKPYDQFLLEQIAGDELFDYRKSTSLKSEEREKLVATGFLRMGPDGTYSTSQAFVPERLQVVADQVQILTSTVLGLTVACARCHDHKYDPIPQRDYYRLSAILRSAYDPYDWLSPSETEVGPEAQWDGNNTRFLSGILEEEVQAVEDHNSPIQEKIRRIELELEDQARPLRKQLLEEKWSKVPEGVRKDVRTALETPSEERTGTQKYLVEKLGADVTIELGELEKRFESFKQLSLETKEAIAQTKKELKPIPRIRALFDMGDPVSPVHILHRGLASSPGIQVEPGVPSVLTSGLRSYRVEKPTWTTDTSGRRLGLAKWLIQPNHPLTARVIVNRIWQRYFRVGLVRTEGNFGRAGTPPSHPELLDWLATELVRRQWSLKALHRLILTSRAYRQSSLLRPESERANPNNILLSRFPMRRLDGDAIRDSVLKASGLLDPIAFGPPDEVEVKSDGEVVAKGTGKGYRRSIYLKQRRSTPVTMLDTFDAPQLRPNCLRRTHSTVSSQALQMMNSEMIRKSSRYMAGRVIDTVGEDVAKQVERVYLAALSRPPSALESDRAESTLRNLAREWMKHLEEEVPAEPRRAQSQWLALATLSHTVLNSAEFLYID